jgi:hypothetical protein
MAASSITANFEIRDEKEAKAFLSALLSPSRPKQPPARKRNWTFAGGIGKIKRHRPGSARS